MVFRWSRDIKSPGAIIKIIEPASQGSDKTKGSSHLCKELNSMKDNENKTNGLLMLCILMFSILIFSPFQSWTQEIEIKTENGVIVVSNPKTPSPAPEGPSILKLKGDLIIGASEKEDYWFSALNSIAVDDSGNIYTLDPKEVRMEVIRVY